MSLSVSRTTLGLSLIGLFTYTLFAGLEMPFRASMLPVLASGLALPLTLLAIYIERKTENERQTQADESGGDPQRHGCISSALLNAGNHPLTATNADDPADHDAEGYAMTLPTPRDLQLSYDAENHLPDVYDKSIEAFPDQQHHKFLTIFHKL